MRSLDAPSSCHTCRSLVFKSVTSEPKGKDLQTISDSNDIRVFQSVKGLQRGISPVSFTKTAQEVTHISRIQ